MKHEIEILFADFKTVTGEPVSAAVLTLAEIISRDPGKRTGLTTKEAAAYLGVGVTTVKSLCSDGRLSSVRIGRSIRFNVDELERFQRRSQPVEDVSPVSHLRHFQRKK